MPEFRITKFNPEFRTASGVYARDEWTSVGDIGRTFDGAVFSRDEYNRTEDAYVEAAQAFLGEAGISSLEVRGLENHGRATLTVEDDDSISIADAGGLIRKMLRQEFWCRLESEVAFVHVGQDYYMYVGVPNFCSNAEQVAKRLGLFVEPMPSPYRPV